MEDQRAEEVWFENEWRSGRNPGQGCGCPVNIPVYPDYTPAYTTLALAMVLCGCQRREYKSDCYFYSEGKQMRATIPTCSYYSKGLGFCPCEGCKKYINVIDVCKMAKDAVDKD